MVKQVDLLKKEDLVRNEKWLNKSKELYIKEITEKLEKVLQSKKINKTFKLARVSNKVWYDIIENKYELIYNILNKYNIFAKIKVKYPMKNRVRDVYMNCKYYDLRIHIFDQSEYRFKILRKIKSKQKPDQTTFYYSKKGKSERQMYNKYYNYKLAAEPLGYTVLFMDTTDRGTEEYSVIVKL